MDDLSNSHQGSRGDSNNNGVRRGAWDRNVANSSAVYMDASTRGFSSSDGISATSAPGMPPVAGPLSLSLSSLIQSNHGNAESRSTQGSLAPMPSYASASSASVPNQPVQSNNAIAPELIWALASMRTGLQQQPQPNQQITDGSMQNVPTNTASGASLLAELLLASRLGSGAQALPQKHFEANDIISLAQTLTSALQGPNVTDNSQHGYNQGPQIRLEGLQALLQQRQLPPQQLPQQSESFAGQGQGTTISQESSSRGFPVGSSHPQQYIGGSTAAESAEQMVRPRLAETSSAGAAPQSMKHDSNKHEKRHEDKKDRKKKRKKSSGRKDSVYEEKPSDSKIDSVIPTSGGEPHVDGDAVASAQEGGGGRPFLLPCRARGMPPEHNFRYAHFVIPPTIQHGEELICSYEACRNNGIKFRYCASCRIPVAKRNFNQRHSHGLPHVATIHSSWTSDIKNAPAVVAAAVAAAFGDVDPPKIVKKSIDVLPTPEPEPAPDSSEVSSSLECSSETSSRKKRRKHHQSRDPSPPPRKGELTTVSVPINKPKPKKKSRDHKKKRPAGASLISEPMHEILMDRQRRWATLLGNRPEVADSDRMSAWLLEVMAISDLNHPIGNNNAGTSSLTSGSEFSSTDEEDKDDDEQQQQDRAGEEQLVDKSGASSSSAASSEESDETTEQSTTKSSLTSSPIVLLPPDSSIKDDAAAAAVPKKKRSSTKVKKTSRKRSLPVNNNKERLSHSFAEWKERKKKRAEDAAAHEESLHFQEV